MTGEELSSGGVHGPLTDHLGDKGSKSSRSWLLKSFFRRQIFSKTLSNIIYKVFLNGETLRLFVLAGYFLYLNLEQEENNTTQKVCLLFLVFYSGFKYFNFNPANHVDPFLSQLSDEIFGVLNFEQFYVKCNISEETVRFLIYFILFFH